MVLCGRDGGLNVAMRFLFQQKGGIRRKGGGRVPIKQAQLALCRMKETWRGQRLRLGGQVSSGEV